MGQTMIYVFKAGDIYAVEKATGELVWDEDLGGIMGQLIVENLTAIDHYMAQTPDVVATIDMPVSRWIQELDFRELQEMTPSDEDYYRFLAGLPKRVFWEGNTEESKCFLRMRVFVQKINQLREKAPRLTLIKN